MRVSNLSILDSCSSYEAMYTHPMFLCTYFLPQVFLSISNVLASILYPNTENHAAGRKRLSAVLFSLMQVYDHSSYEDILSQIICALIDTIQIHFSIISVILNMERDFLIPNFPYIYLNILPLEQ